jgi:hypothetical protein
VSDEQYVFEGVTCIFSGTAKEVADWTRGHISERDTRIEVEVSKNVCVPIKDYFKSLHDAEKAAEHTRNTTILHMVTSAMAKQAKATYQSDTDGMDLVAKQTADAIIELFEKE